MASTQDHQNKAVPVITWCPCMGDKRVKLRNDNGTPFQVRAVGTASGDTWWEIEVFSGRVDCRPTDADGNPRRGLVADFTFFAPSNLVDPRPDTPKTVDRRPMQVGSADGLSGRLTRGHAMVVTCGAGSLVVSWDYPEYGHPKV